MKDIKLKSFNVNHSVLEVVYKSHLMFNITAWYGNMGVRNKNKFHRRAVEKIMGRQQTYSDSTHPFYSEFVKLSTAKCTGHYTVQKYLTSEWRD